MSESITITDRRYGVYTLNPTEISDCPDCDPQEDFVIVVCGYHRLTATIHSIQGGATNLSSGTKQPDSWMISLVDTWGGHVWVSDPFPSRRLAQQCCREIFDDLDNWMASHHLTDLFFDIRELERHL